MKTNRMARRRRAPLDRLLSGAPAALLALSFIVSIAIDRDRALAQSRRKPTRNSAAQVKRPPQNFQLRSFEFETVTVNSKGAITDRRKGQARYYVENINGVGLEMVEIPGGSFWMGSEKSTDGGPKHQVNVPPFYLGKYEVTQAQWQAVAKLPKVNHDLNPDCSNFKGNNLPAEQVSWQSAMEFCARLSRATGRIYRLPTEAEWEYACRAGTTTEFSFGETITPEIANFDGNEPYGSAPKGMARKRTIPVGSLGIANGFGLYDMHGNVEESTLDHRHDNYHGAPTDGSAWIGLESAFAGLRITRGGDYRRDAYFLRSGFRNQYNDKAIGVPASGFRVAAVIGADVGASDFVELQKATGRSSVPSKEHDGNELQHKWHIEEGQKGIVNYISEYPTPAPYSYVEEPEATLASVTIKITGKPPSLNTVVTSEIKSLRQELQLAAYLEADGHQPEANIASWVEEIEGQQVAFIKYRTVGVKGKPRGIPRSIRHAILIKNGALYFVHLTVLFAKHQQEVRDDQIRLVKGIIRKYTRNE